MEKFFEGIFWEKFFGRIFLGGFFGRIIFRRIFLGGILWVEINQELMFLSRFWGIFVSMQGRKEEGRKEDF